MTATASRAEARKADARERLLAAAAVIYIPTAKRTNANVDPAASEGLQRIGGTSAAQNIARHANADPREGMFPNVSGGEGYSVRTPERRVLSSG